MWKELNNGHKIPYIGRNLLIKNCQIKMIIKYLFNFNVVGAYKVTPSQLDLVIPEAINSGYRLFGNNIMKTFLYVD